MISLFVSDIDGCIAEPYQPFQLERLTALVDLLHDPDPAVPSFSLLSGRAYAYVEAISQLLGLTTPVLFESGGGMFDPEAARVKWNPALTPEVERDLQEIRHWLVADCLPGTNMMFDYGKRTQMGIVGPDFDEVMEVVPRVERFVQENFPVFRVFHTPVSIDISLDRITKRQGMQWLSEELDVPLEKIAYIGDTNGDLPALEIVGHSFAPANAASAVRRMVDHVMDAPVADGVYAALEQCIDINRRSRRISATGS